MTGPGQLAHVVPVSQALLDDNERVGDAIAAHLAEQALRRAVIARDGPTCHRSIVTSEPGGISALYARRCLREGRGLHLEQDMDGTLRLRCWQHRHGTPYDPARYVVDHGTKADVLVAVTDLAAGESYATRSAALPADSTEWPP